MRKYLAYAIGEILLVVIGILIALQINNWNEERAERVEEKAFLQRLSQDVDLAREKLSIFLTVREFRLKTIRQVENMYFGDAQIEPLSEDDCTNVADMHIITHPPVALASMAEAFAGGRIELISDATLTQSLIAVKQSEDRLSTVIDSLNLDRPDLTQKYPEALTLVRATEPLERPEDKVFARGQYRAVAQCHFLQAPRNPAFLSDMVRGLDMNEAYVFFLKNHLDSLDQLAAVLDTLAAPHPNSEEAK